MFLSSECAPFEKMDGSVENTGRKVMSNKPDYKNWVPKSMIRFV